MSVSDATLVETYLEAASIENAASDNTLAAYRAELRRFWIAAALGLAPDRVLKTLMAWVDARAVCAVIPSDRQLQPKALAAACGGAGISTSPSFQSGSASTSSPAKTGIETRPRAIRPPRNELAISEINNEISTG